jgi:hypothetical protein
MVENQSVSESVVSGIVVPRQFPIASKLPISFLS